MILPPGRCRELFAAADRVVLATTGADLRPHLVPVTFVLTGDRVLIAIDHKPKTTKNLRRLRNLTENPRVALLADHYTPDWTQLWWTRADGTATVLPSVPTEPLAAKYPQYAETPPTGPFIEIQIEKWTGWSAS
ncbi:PPOX class probable F420-dependent enzyme [Kribbella amoyensis]|uniref:PPOX class probable F420-dependent enzyme n=1 Tax=Kribbella amoyensis TaxID=996641 RepID=A0A561BLV3_9ACTN|nr:TIGR03668 family PPOX class F420-dependent oxidoreductase [Kribbella amoyensis]TWD79839.1 PPOX class probable F420-dependent enzyme [Kribbella amoyensis]